MPESKVNFMYTAVLHKAGATRETRLFADCVAMGFRMPRNDWLKRLQK